MKRQDKKDKNTKKKTKAKRQKDKDQKENMILRRQGSFALLRCFKTKWLPIIKRLLSLFRALTFVSGFLSSG